jgi:DNA (cytosine-5)-methyltransferase 1
MATSMIKNHYSAKLSALDVRMVKNVPPGGNWKNIPTSIPSKRLEQIRIGFENGSGSRSTYYGRLLPNKPAYTISTYFNRPGNGCFIHYATDQHRLISQREAARLQSFPDDFIFEGAVTSQYRQIGNAVPWPLAYHVAKNIPLE